MHTHKVHEICTHVTDEFPIQFKAVKNLIIVEKLVHKPVDEHEEEPEV